MVIKTVLFWVLPKKSAVYTVYGNMDVSYDLYYTANRIDYFFVSAVFLENRIFQPRYNGTTKKPDVFCPRMMTYEVLFLIKKTQVVFRRLFLVEVMPT